MMQENLALTGAEKNHKQVQVPFCSVCDIKVTSHCSKTDFSSDLKLCQGPYLMKRDQSSACLHRRVGFIFVIQVSLLT